ncbi:MAG: phosphoribosylformylglycinamidine synthase subunit PurS [Acidobacteriota bacterium]|nr:phosphoribosylformylglycinamidine synthase subunit PurS [Blastocatellia bacterium]MDW8239884.1 phosphoribosylformylglycinamidine synthase subunit PurS [Acidobacteriota bacterium]
MKAKILVTLKKTVLDPQGQTILQAVRTLGYETIHEIRQGKYFEITLDDSVNPDDARAQMEQLARDVLSNPVLEEYNVLLEESS